MWGDNWIRRRCNIGINFYLTSFFMLKNVKISHDLTASRIAPASKKVLFVTDQKIWNNCAKFFPADFLQKNHRNLFLRDPKADEKNLKKIAAAAQDCDFILGLGSGTINDLCKFTSAQKNIPYAIFASAPSMNGYLSKNASITISGHKKTLPATLPKMVFCDLRILKSAPLKLTKAGIGDSLCFYSCWFDWYLSHKILGTKFDKKPFEMLREKMESLLKNFGKFSLRDEEFLRLLIEIILLSGRGMTIAGGSYPASQSEHMIAHTIEMKYPKIAEKKLHGEMIATTTLTSAALQKKVLSAKCLAPRDEEKIGNFFSQKITKQCKEEYLQKLAIKRHKVDWSKLKKELQKIYFDETRLKEIFSHFKINTAPKSLGLSNQQYQDCVAHAKFTRNRFTCLDFFN